MTTAINLNALLKQTIVLARENEDWTSEQIIAELMSNHVEIQSLAPISMAATEKTTKAGKAETEKKTRTRSAPAKPRAIPDDDTRCCARSFYEKEHIEDGVAKVMRDDSDNLYGDRCKFKTIVDKTENPDTFVAPAPKKAVTKAPLVLIDDDHEESEAEQDEETEIVMAPPSPKKATPVKKAAPVAVAVAPAPVKTKPVPKIEEPEEPVEEEAAEVEEVVIDGETYLKDEDNTIYDPETEEAVGVYSFTKMKWISRK